MNHGRCRRLIAEAIKKTGLDLVGLTVLTEAATGVFALTPVIAAAAGAERVLCLGRNSRFGTLEEAWRQVSDLRDAVCPKGRIELLSGRDDHRLWSAQVVTNLGFLRPLDRPFLRTLSRTVAVSLMWETWEFRPEDIDLPACRELGIPVLGTNEHVPELRIFEYLGVSALQLLLALECEVFLARVVILGQGEFAAAVESTLRSAGAAVDYFDTRARLDVHDVRLAASIREADAIVVVDHHRRDYIISEDGDFTPKAIAALNSAVGIAHICGGVSAQAVAEAGLLLVPQHIAAPGHMSVTPANLGPRPLIDLHAAGLRVGAELVRARMGGVHGLEAEARVVTSLPMAHGWENLPRARNTAKGASL